MAWEIDEDIQFLNKLRQGMKDGLQQLVTDAATAGLEAAKSAVPDENVSRGYSLGSLKESGYVLSRITDGYSEAVSAALSVPGTRIATRSQVMPPFPIAQEENFSNDEYAVAVFDFPLVYAEWINDGFHHLLAKRFIIGVAYITTGINAGTARMRVQEAKLITELMNIHS